MPPTVEGSPLARRDDIRAGFVAEIESLRGIAITLVFLYHADCLIARRPFLGGTLVSPLAALVLGGHTGVSLFFVLSGFLLVPPFLSEAIGGRHVQRSTYYARRALRILPLYLLAVCMATLLSARHAADLLHGLPYLVFSRTGIGGTEPLWPYSGVWWSLRTEVQFYLLLPFVPWFVRSRWRRWSSIVAVAAYTALYIGFVTRCLELRSWSDQLVLFLSVFGRAPQFALGALAGWLYGCHGAALRSWARNAAWRGRVTGDAAMLATLVALAYLLQRVVSIGFMGAELGWNAWHLLEGALWTAMLLLLLLAPLRTKTVFSNQLWGALGRWSYSIYMIHFPLMWFYVDGIRRIRPGAFTSWDVPSVAAMSVLAAACIGLSATTYRTIERPFLRRKVRISEPGYLRATTVVETGSW